MIVLTKKKILKTLGILGITILTVSLFFNLGIQTTETKETVSLPVSNKVIVIDAGHRCSR